MSISESDLFKIYQALGNPHRRNIIMLLGENPEGLTFSELRKMLNLSVGTLYYNLDQLDDLICQKSDKRYALSKKGLIAYRMLKDDLEKIKSEPSSDLVSRLQAMFFPRWFFMFLESRGSLLPLLAIAVILMGSIACEYNGLVLNITWIGHTMTPFLGFSSFIWSWLITSIASFVIVSRNIKEKLKVIPRYLAEMGFATFPLAIFVAVEPMLRLTIIKVVTQVMLWLLAIILMSSALSRSTRCKPEIALLVVILVMFIATLAIPQLVTIH
ncbi:MAG: helix-turn-helix domain-containing protein [Candidatus Nezhaarchaeota archaeon]|nr:helix-turn-helix domain-containing protein [Candidatus Nezhaarchaeota archaeon]